MHVPVKKVIEAGKQLVEAWTAVPIGTAVVLRKDDGTELATKTASAPQMLGGHSPVIWLEGVRGCYHLSRVRRA